MHLALAYLGRESIELEYLSAVAKAAGHRVSFAYDPGAFTDNDNVLCHEGLARRFSRTDLLERQLRRDVPDVLLLFLYSNTLTWGRQLVSRLRTDHRVPTIFTGLHATMAPQAVMAHDEADFVMLGEGEQTLPELLDALAGKRPIDSVRGIYYRDGQTVRTTGIRPPLADLDALPWPDKELFAPEFNMADDYVIQCGRGCPCSCTYCRQGTLRRLFGEKYFRRRRVEAIIDELVSMRERYGFRRVMIEDPIFFVPKDWTLSFLNAYQKHVGLPFRCYGQVKWFDHDIALALKQAGCYGVEFGLQTTNERIRREILDRNESDEQVRQAFTLCDKLNLRYDIDHIFGLPGETPEDFVDAAHLYADARRLNRVKVHLLAYFAGAPIVGIAEQMGLVDEKLRQDIENGHVGDICRVPGYADQRTQALIREWKTFYKLMPLLGRNLGHTFVRRGWHRHFGRIPFPLEILLQLLVALRGRDQRFIVYLKYLVFRLRRDREVRRAAGHDRNHRAIRKGNLP